MISQLSVEHPNYHQMNTITESVLSAKINNHSKSQQNQNKKQGFSRQSDSGVNNNNAQRQQNSVLKTNGEKVIGGLTSNLRTIIKQQEKEYTEPKPFQKKYGLPNKVSTLVKEVVPPKSKQERSPETNRQPLTEGKSKTKQSFNDKLTNNIIKDETSPTTKHSFRIKKVENRSPKQLRDDLVSLNEQEHQVQMLILQLHKKHKGELERIKENYGVSLNADKVGTYFKKEELIAEDGEAGFETKINDLLRLKKKEMQKMQRKIEQNKYLQYLANLPQEIAEMNSSEQQEDIVEQLPVQPISRMINNQGCYSTTMSELKTKKHALNLRLTYEVFKQQEKVETEVVQSQTQNIQSGDNRVTLNNKFRDFLLN